MKSQHRKEEIDWRASDEDRELLTQIAEKAVKQFKKAGVKIDFQDTLMDLTACHLNGCPLRLADMLEAGDFNLVHDIAGIARHIDRTSGKLTMCFLPRFSA